MSWPEVIVIVSGIAGLVSALAVSLPYLRPRGADELKASALADLNQRLRDLEAHATRPGLPTGLPRSIRG